MREQLLPNYNYDTINLYRIEVKELLDNIINDEKDKKNFDSNYVIFNRIRLMKRSINISLNGYVSINNLDNDLLSEVSYLKNEIESLYDRLIKSFQNIYFNNPAMIHKHTIRLDTRVVRKKSSKYSSDDHS